MLYDVFDIFVYASYDGMRYYAILRQLPVKQGGSSNRSEQLELL
jgi:hypothetical protein